MNGDEFELISASVAGRRRSWCAAGDGGGVPLVLLHGIGSNARAWAGQLAHFAKTRRVIAWNAPGYPGSERLKSAAPSPADYAAALLALADHLGIGRFALVGQSLGAIMAAAAVQLAPARIAALALVSPASGYAIAPGAALPDNIIQRMALARTLGPEGLADARAARLLGPDAPGWASRIVHRAMAEIDPDGYEQASRMLAHTDLAAMVETLDIPAMVVWGSADIITPPESCVRIADRFSGAQRHCLEGKGHAVATEAPDAFNRVLEQFLADCGLTG